jgi:hypothetical protein
MAIAQFPSLVLDCPDPAPIATFYGALLDWKVELSDDWADVKADYGQCLSFQKVDDYTPPVWPGQDVPQQMHLDVMVDDLDEGDAEVLALGARPLGGDHVYADPAGHPFCLIPRPHWAPPVRSPRAAGPTAGR